MSSLGWSQTVRRISARKIGGVKFVQPSCTCAIYFGASQKHARVKFALRQLDVSPRLETYAFQPVQVSSSSLEVEAVACHALIC